MKRLAAIVLAVLLVAVIATQAFAESLTLGGENRSVIHYREKTTTVIETFGSLMTVQIRAGDDENGDVIAAYTIDMETGEIIDADDGKAMPEGDYYVLNINTKKIHMPDCKSVNDIAPENRRDVAGPIDEYLLQGYKPCQRCMPD